MNLEELKFFNEYGGFSSDGKEYIINVNKIDHILKPEYKEIFK